MMQYFTEELRRLEIDVPGSHNPLNHPAPGQLLAYVK